MEIPLVVNYIIDGAVGGLLYILVSKLGYSERWDIIRRLLIGAISGLIIYYSGLPNHLTAIGLGYVGIDAIEAILIKTGNLPKTTLCDKKEQQ